MADPVLGIGPNVNAYRAALKAPTSQSRQMAQMARIVTQTLNAAFLNVPMPVSTPTVKRDQDILKLREAIESMVLVLTTTVKEGGFDGIEWPDAASHLFSPEPFRSTDQHKIDDDVTLSVRSRQLSEADPEILAAMEEGLHPLEDADVAQKVAWLAQAQVLHQAILSLQAQSNIERSLAERVLEIRDANSIQTSLALRAKLLTQDEEQEGALQENQEPRGQSSIEDE